MTRLVAAWQRFWFQPESTATLVILRVAFGGLALMWTVTWAPDLFTFYSANGIIPTQPPLFGWGLLEVFPDDGAVIGLYFALIVASVCVIVGFQTRLACLVVWVGMLSFYRRDPWTFNSGDLVLRHLAFYLMLAPAGAAFSVDRWLSYRERFWEIPWRAPWALRLIQVQVCLVYLFAVVPKLQGATWINGTAVSYALRLGDLQRFPVPAEVTQSVLVANLLTYGTLIVEAAIPVLVWNRTARPYVLALGAFMHLSIEYAFLIGFFSFAMITSYLAFVPPDRADRLLVTARSWLVRRRTHIPTSAPQSASPQA
jgi:hypothetical protein